MASYDQSVSHNAGLSCFTRVLCPPPSGFYPVHLSARQEENMVQRAYLDINSFIRSRLIGGTGRAASILCGFLKTNPKTQSEVPKFIKSEPIEGKTGTPKLMPRPVPPQTPEVKDKIAPPTVEEVKPNLRSSGATPQCHSSTITNSTITNSTISNNHTSAHTTRATIPNASDPQHNTSDTPPTTPG